MWIFLLYKIIAISCSFSNSTLLSTTSKVALRTQIFQNEKWLQIDTGGLHLFYPVEWEKKKMENNPSSLFIFAPESTIRDKFRDNINFLRQDLNGKDYDLEAYIKLTLDQIAQNTLESNILSRSVRKKKGQSFAQIDYRCILNTMHLEFHQIVWIEKGNAYVLTLTTLDYPNNRNLKSGIKILEQAEFHAQP